MICPKCKKKDPQNREMCPFCGAPVKPIPMPPSGRVHFGDYDWFVLDRQDGKMLVITEKVIAKRAYHSEETAVTWETCDVRSYLNGPFYQSLSKADRARVVEVVNENPDNPWYGTSGGNATKDRIFLLSIGEVVQYFGDSGQIKTRYMYPSPWGDWCKDEFLPWIDDQYSLNRRSVDDEGVVRFWRLRSPGANNRFVAAVTGFCGDGFDQGGIDIGGCGDLDDGHFVFYGFGHLSGNLPNGNTLNGLRPALWLKLEE